MCKGLSLNSNDVWSKDMLRQELKQIVAKHRDTFGARAERSEGENMEQETYIIEDKNENKNHDNVEALGDGDTTSVS